MEENLKKRNQMFLFMHCKHLVKEDGGSKCNCALNQPSFWGEDMCHIDKNVLCAFLEVVEPVVSVTNKQAYEDVEIDDEDVFDANIQKADTKPTN